MKSALMEASLSGEQEPVNPFGANLLTETPDNLLRIGNLACVQNTGTQSDDSEVTTVGDGDDKPPITTLPPRKYAAHDAYSEVSHLN